MKVEEQLIKKYEKYIISGKGQKAGSDYEPFLQVHNNKVASDGWITRHLGWKTNRTHHTLSKHELNYLYYLEWMDQVVDIKEQFLLEPLSRTVEIAEELGIKHPHINGVIVPMTTDFVITLQTTDGLKDIVRTVKPASKLSKRTLETFEIERRFFEEKGIDWGIVLAENLPTIFIMNIRWIEEGRFLKERTELEDEHIDFLAPILLQEIVVDNLCTSINKICLTCDKEFGVNPGTSMLILKYMLANKRWGTDMTIKIKELNPLRLYNLSNTHEVENENAG